MGGAIEYTPCKRRHSKHTIWFWQEDGDPMPVPREVVRDDHHDAIALVEEWITDAPDNLRWIKVFRTHNESYECWRWTNEAPWPPPHRHVTQVIYTRPWRAWFRKRYWVRCWEDCNLNAGPFIEAHRAKDRAAALNDAVGACG